MALASDLRAAYNKKYGPGAAKGVSDHDLRANYNAMYGAGAAAQLKAGTPPPAATQPTAQPTAQPAQGILSPPPTSTPEPAPPPPQALPALTTGQNEVINNTQTGDIQLGEAANELLPEINQSFEQPFDWGKYQAMAPVQGDYQGWVNSQMQNYNNAFDQRMNPQFQQQAESFEQQMANRGIPMGSELYNREKTRMEQAQNDARSQAYANHQGQAIQGAQSLFGIGTQAQQNALGLGQAARYGSLNDYNALQGAQSGMGMQNLGFSQNYQLAQLGYGNQQQLAQQGFDWQRQLQDDQQKAAMQQLKYAAKNRGGGPGPTAWQQAGFGSYQDMAAFEDARRRGQLQWDFENNPSYRQEGGPSVGAQIGGGLLGTGLSLLGQYAGQNWF